MNLLVDRIYSIDAFSIALLKEFSLFGFPNKRVLTILSSFSVKMFASIVAILCNGERNESLFQYHYCSCTLDLLSLESYV